MGQILQYRMERETGRTKVKRFREILSGCEGVQLLVISDVVATRNDDSAERRACSPSRQAIAIILRLDFNQVRGHCAWRESISCLC